MYIEASSPRKQGDNAKISLMVTLSGKSCLKFYYHMYGGSMGALNVKLSDVMIFSKSGNLGNQWHMKQIRLKGTGTKEVYAYVSWWLYYKSFGKNKILCNNLFSTTYSLVKTLGNFYRKIDIYFTLESQPRPRVYVKSSGLNL